MGLYGTGLADAFVGAHKGVLREEKRQQDNTIYGQNQIVAKAGLASLERQQAAEVQNEKERLSNVKFQDAEMEARQNPSLAGATGNSVAPDVPQTAQQVAPQSIQTAQPAAPALGNALSVARMALKKAEESR